MNALMASSLSYTRVYFSQEKVENISDNESSEEDVLANADSLLEEVKASVIDQVSSAKESMNELEEKIAETIMRRIMEFKQMAVEELLGVGEEGRTNSRALLADLEVYNERGNSLSLANISVEHTEAFSFSFSGEALSEDGQSMAFDVEVSVTERLAREQKLTRDYEKWVELHDPLVINYAGNGVDLSDKTFKFDLDSDGASDQISLLNQGSGFLVLDKNENGMVDNGNELFGTKSGDGFKDLSIFDEDNNGWIDKNDSVFDKLRIWKRDESGDNSLVALGEVGIGAISVQAQENQQDFLSAAGDLNGRMQKSAVFLKENGETGGIHHIDLAKHKNANPGVSYESVGNSQKRIDELREQEPALLKQVEELKEQLSDKENAIDSEEAENKIKELSAEIANIKAVIALQELDGVSA